MKKILLSVVCLMIVGMQSVMAQAPAAIMLMHQGQAKLYSGQELVSAVSAAEAGDSIFLSNGTFSVVGGLTINKPISLIGAGQNTIISGEVTVDIDSTATITGRLLDALKLTRSLIVNQNPDAITIRKCWIPNNLQLNENARNMIVDRCYVRYFVPLEGYSSTFSATNSVFSQCGGENIMSHTGNVIFTNCNLGGFYVYHWASFQDYYSFIENATFVNCLIGSFENSSSTNTFINCGGNSDTNNTNLGVFDNCYNLTSHSNIKLRSFDENSGFPTFARELCSAENLQKGNYLGTDGTIIGAEGGSTPYNLNPSLPTVSQSSFTVDNSTRTLNVTLTVTSE